jgi:hypothetical protein
MLLTSSSATNVTTTIVSRHHHHYCQVIVFYPHSAVGHQWAAVYRFRRKPFSERNKTLHFLLFCSARAVVIVAPRDHQSVAQPLAACPPARSLTRMASAISSATSVQLVDRTDFQATNVAAVYSHCSGGDISAEPGERTPDKRAVIKLPIRSAQWTATSIAAPDQPIYH